MTSEEELNYLKSALDTEWERSKWTALDKFFDAAFPYLAALVLLVIAVGLFRWLT